MIKQYINKVCYGVDADTDRLLDESIPVTRSHCETQRRNGLKIEIKIGINDSLAEEIAFQRNNNKVETINIHEFTY